MAQCAGVTLKGDRCKRTAVEGSVYCNTHQYQSDPGMKTRTDAKNAGKNAGEDAGGGDHGDCGRAWADPTTWDRETVMFAALGFLLAGALILTKGRR